MSTSDYKPMLITFFQPKYNIWISRMEGCIICLEALEMAAILFKENSFSKNQPNFDSAFLRQ